MAAPRLFRSLSVVIFLVVMLSFYFLFCVWCFVVCCGGSESWFVFHLGVGCRFPERFFIMVGSVQRLLVSLVLLGMLVGSAWGQVLTRFSFADLVTEPGVVLLSPSYLTLIEFPDLVQTVASGRSDLIQVEVDDSRILLRPTRSMGKTDLIVKVAGVNMLFVLEVDAENGMPRRYVVEPAERGLGVATPVQPGSVVREAPSGNTDVTRMPVASVQLGGEVVPGSGTMVLPFEFSYSARLGNSGNLVIYYSLHNRSVNPIVNEGTRLRVVDQIGVIPYSVVRMNPSGTQNRLAAGMAEHGVLTLERSVLGIPRLEWAIVEQGPGQTYMINELVVNISVGD